MEMDMDMEMDTKGVLDVQGAFLNLESMRLNPIRVEKHG